MKINSNLKDLKFNKRYYLNYSIDEFMNLSMFNPINEKKYFSQYNLKQFQNKKFRVHVFGMGGSSLSSKLLQALPQLSHLNGPRFGMDP